MKPKHLIITIILLCAALVAHNLLPDHSSETRIPDQTCTPTDYSFVIPSEALAAATTNCIASLHETSISTRRPGTEESRPGSLVTSAGRFISKSLLSRYFHISPNIPCYHLRSGDFPVSVGILII